MTIRSRARQKGQAIVMVTLALIAMCGILGLAVDLGWSYFVRRNAQSFADAGALAAVEEALRLAGASALNYCGNSNINACNATFSCPSSLGADPNHNLDNGCAYIRGTDQGGGTYFGFVDGSNGGRTQMAQLDSGSGLLTLSDGAQINTFYWVRARVSENIPQLFSAVMGNRSATVAATATAAIIGLPIDASIILTNRENESSPVGPTGNEVVGKNMFVNGGSDVSVPGGIRLASNVDRAGEIGSNGTVTASYTYTRAPNGTTYDPNGHWPYTQKDDSDNLFSDPFGGLGQGNPSAGYTPTAQPPITPQQQPDCPVPGGLIDGGNDPANPLVLGPGNYYAVDRNGAPTWSPIQFKGNVRFGARNTATPSTVFTSTSRSTSIPCMVGATTNGATDFGHYFFYGGFQNGSGGAVATVEPGMYVIAGAQPKNNGSPNDVLAVNSNMSLLDLNAGQDPPSSPNTNAGEIFVLTDPNYPGLQSNQWAQIPALANASPAANLKFGTANLQAGSQTMTLQLHGLTPGNTQFVDSVDTQDHSLKNFESILFWQDQANSRVRYRADGTISTDWSPCSPASAGPVGINNPCTTSLRNSKSPQLSYQGSANSNVYGVFYQPRGAWMYLQGGGTSTNIVKTMIVSGALQTGGTVGISFGPIVNPPIERRVALVE